VPCSGYTPQQVKGAVCGSGRAQKDQVARMVRVLLGLAHDPQPDHAADALAVAICHINSAPHAAALARASDGVAAGANRRTQTRAPAPAGSGL
jgi:crossover junction endodeoxyribonuclease RuvC